MVPKTFLITPYHSLSVYLSWYGSYTMHDNVAGRVYVPHSKTIMSTH
jgi:hypothetical protein